jgi:F-box protein 10
VCNGLADGIVIGQNGRGRVEGNTIKGAFVIWKAALMLYFLWITGNVGCGVWVMGGHPLIQLNEIYNNTDTAVSFIQTREADEDMSLDGGESDSVASASPIDFDAFDISGAENSQTDESTSAPLFPRLKYNTIYHNNGLLASSVVHSIKVLWIFAGFGVLAQCGEQILLQGNAIHSNHDTGVFIKQNSAVSLVSNSVTCNAGAGLHIAAGSKAGLEGNGIYDNRGHGVLVQGEASIQSNDIFSNQLCAVIAESAADCKVRT